MRWDAMGCDGEPEGLTGGENRLEAKEERVFQPAAGGEGGQECPPRGGDGRQGCRRSQGAWWMPAVPGTLKRR